jgi:ribose/xylose/arabinose/galactoside ABC-type transport system permease subunit
MTPSETAGRRLLTRLTSLPAGAYLLLVLVLGLALFAPRFLDPTNLANVSRVAAVLALAACGQAVIILVGGIDLSVGSVAALMSVVIVLNIDRGVPVAMVMGVVVALAVGVINGLLVARFDVPPFLVTLGMLTGLHGLASVLVGGIPLEAPAGGGFSWLSSRAIGPFPVPFLLAVAALGVLALLLRGTVLGRAWFLVGSNRQAAAAAGVHVRRTLFAAYVVGALFAALAGLVLTARVHSGQPNLFPSLPFEAIAACAIGGLPLTGGAASAARVLVGVSVIALADNGLQLLDLSSAAQLIVIGVLTVGAVLVQQTRLRGRGRAPAPAAEPPATVRTPTLEEAP